MKRYETDEVGRDYIITAQGTPLYLNREGYYVFQSQESTDYYIGTLVKYNHRDGFITKIPDTNRGFIEESFSKIIGIADGVNQISVLSASIVNKGMTLTIGESYNISRLTQEQLMVDTARVVLLKIDLDNLNTDKNKFFVRSEKDPNLHFWIDFLLNIENVEPAPTKAKEVINRVKAPIEHTIPEAVIDTTPTVEQSETTQIVHHLQVPIYNWSVVFAVGFPATELYMALVDFISEPAALHEVLNNAKSVHPHTIGMHYGITDENTSVIWLPEYPTANKIPAIAHECLHATNCILGNKGLMLTRDSEEAYCYLHTFIFEHLLKFLNLC